MDDNCDVSDAIERHRTERMVDRILRGISCGHLLVAWFVMHNSDQALQERTNISAELWAWDREMHDADERGDLIEHAQGTGAHQGRRQNPVLGYDAGDGV